MMSRAGSVVVDGKEYDLAGDDDVSPAPVAPVTSAATQEVDWGTVVAAAASFLKTYKLNAEASDEWSLAQQGMLPDGLRPGLPLIAHSNFRAKELNFNENKLGAGGVRMMCESLATNKHAVSLYLFENKISNEGAAQLAGLLRTPDCRLAGLFVSFNSIGAAGGSALFDALATNASLTSLDLSENELEDTAATALGTTMAKNNTLRVLLLNKNHITDVGARALANGLTVNSTLTDLNLSANRFGDASGKAFGDALASNHGLKIFYFQGNKALTSAGSKLIKAAGKMRPNLTIMI